MTFRCERNKQWTCPVNTVRVVSPKACRVLSNFDFLRSNSKTLQPCAKGVVSSHESGINLLSIRQLFLVRAYGNWNKPS